MQPCSDKTFGAFVFYPLLLFVLPFYFWGCFAVFFIYFFKFEGSIVFYILFTSIILSDLLISNKDFLLLIFLIFYWAGTSSLWLKSLQRLLVMHMFYTSISLLSHIRATVSGGDKPCSWDWWNIWCNKLQKRSFCDSNAAKLSWCWMLSGLEHIVFSICWICPFLFWWA